MFQNKCLCSLKIQMLKPYPPKWWHLEVGLRLNSVVRVGASEPVYEGDRDLTVCGSTEERPHERISEGVALYKCRKGPAPRAEYVSTSFLGFPISRTIRSHISVFGILL